MSKVRDFAEIISAGITASDVGGLVHPEYDDDKIQTNIALLAFKTAINGSLAKYSLQDQIVDEYVTDAGVNTGDSTNETLTSGVYTSSVNNNYFGDDSDGTVTTSGNVTHTVLNKVGSYDGDMLVKNYTNLTIASGHTMTVDQPCRGMLIYCTGDCTIAGTLSMNSKGAFANPTASGGSDSNAVQANGLQIGFVTSGGSTNFTNANTNFNGCGTTARTSIANFPNTVSNGTTITVPRQGAAGANGPTGSMSAGNAGTNGSSGSTGGGGSGSGYLDDPGVPTNGRLGDGSYGSCFVGGSGGGSSGGTVGRSTAHMDSVHATAWGGPGGIGTGSTTHGGFAIQGGAGSLTGDGFCAGGPCSNSDYHATGEAGHGGGGLIILIVGGNLTVTGTISANGGTPNGLTGTVNAITGGGAGGGSIVYAYSGTLSNSGTIQASGGPGTTAYSSYNPGAGGNGSLQSLAISGSSFADLILQSTDTTAEVPPTKADIVILMEDAAGVASLDVSSGDIKAYISMYETGSPAVKAWTQATLTDEGDWDGTTKRILVAHDVILTGTSGTQMAYKITTHNQSTSKEIKIHATSIGWK